MPPTRIYLTGFMGSGKSTVGPLLAERSGYAFLDLDDAVAERAGRSVAAVFAESGEAAFRTFEAAALRTTGTLARTVVALGGGAVAADANLDWTLEHGTLVYLRLPADELARRLATAAADRPLLQDPGGGPLAESALTERIATLLAGREPFYERAHVIVDAAGQTVEETVEAVWEAMLDR